MSAIELSRGKQVQRGGKKSDPCGAANRMQQYCQRIHARKKPLRQQPQYQWHTENNICVGGINSRYHSRVHHAINQNRNCDREADEWSRCADVKQRAAAANWRAHQNKCSKSSYQSRRGNEIWIAGSNAVVFACEVMSKFVRQQNSHQRNGERHAGCQRRRIFVKQFQRNCEFSHRRSLAVCKRNRKLASGGQARQKRNHKKQNCQPQTLWLRRMQALPGWKRDRDFRRGKLQVNCRRGLVIAVHDLFGGLQVEPAAVSGRLHVAWMRESAGRYDVCNLSCESTLTSLPGLAVLCRA